MQNAIEELKSYAKGVDFWSIYILNEESEEIAIRQQKQRPIASIRESGALITVMNSGGTGYAATPDLSASSLKQAFDRARDWAKTYQNH